MTDVQLCPHDHDQDHASTITFSGTVKAWNRIADFKRFEPFDFAQGRLRVGLKENITLNFEPGTLNRPMFGLNVLNVLPPAAVMKAILIR